MPKTDAQFPYDFFISYSQADRAWVEGYLLDALTLANVRVHSELNFALGAPRITEFERAIQQSKRTLLILSPAYLSESGANFVNSMVQYYGLESGTWPVIPLVLEPVELPPRLAFLVSLDATQAERWPEVITRLCQTVHVDVPAPARKPLCPYPGMRSFRAEEAVHFHGRDREIDTLLQRLRLNPLIVIIGASGSGKSSLVFAGLLPALQRSQLFGAGEWLVRTMRPGAQPLTELQRALNGLDLEQFNPSALLASQEGAAHLLLIIDQFEELFTQAASDAATLFASLQHYVAQPGCYLVLTLRADFFDQWLSSPFWSMFEAHRFEIAPLSASGLREAIVKPAEEVGVFIESALVERLVAGSVGQPGLLPFMQEVMVRLWEKLERRYLPLRAYEALVLPLSGYSGSERSGIQAAMAQLADEMINRLAPEQQQVTRRIFLRLVQFGEGRDDTRRQQPISALRAAGEDTKLFDRTLSYLVENRLIVLSGDETSESRVDLAHEAMLTGWPRLQEWITKYKALEVQRRRLEEWAKEWSQLGRSKHTLLDKRQFTEVEVWLKAGGQSELGCSQDLRQLIDLSKRLHLRNRFVTLTKTSVLLLLIALFVTSVVWRWWVNRAWSTVPALRQVSVSAFSTSYQASQELAAGSFGYGVAFYDGKEWKAWNADGLPTGESGKVAEPADAIVDRVVALARDPLVPNALYAWLEGEGIFRLKRDTRTWELLAPGGPIQTTARQPLAVSNGSVIAIGDNLGIQIWDPDKQTWQHNKEPKSFLDQEFEAVVVDKDGVPYLAGQQGVLRGESNPWQWTVVNPVSNVQVMAVGKDGLSYLAASSDSGTEMICLDTKGNALGQPLRLSATNWFLEGLGTLFKPMKVRAMMILPHPFLGQQFYVTTNQGAIFAMNCQGEREWLGQTLFLKASSSQLAIGQKNDGTFTLFWGNIGGLYQRTLRP